MKAFLWVMAIMGVMEVATVFALLSVKKVPERTISSVVINGVAMATLGAWAVYLLVQAYK